MISIKSRSRVSARKKIAQSVGDYIDTAMVFARAHFVKVNGDILLRGRRYKEAD